MAHIFRSILDDLLGPGRNSTTKTVRVSEKCFNDSDVCKQNLVGLCVQDAVSKIDSNVRACGKHHAEYLKSQFETSADHERLKTVYEDELRRSIEKELQCLNVPAKASKTGKQTLCSLLTSSSTQLSECQTRYAAYSHATNEFNATLGVLQKGEDNTERPLLCSPDVVRKALDLCQQEAQFLSSCEKITELLNSNPMAHVFVCEICGKTLCAADTDKRIAEHVLGRYHQCYATFRQKLDKLNLPSAR